MVLFHIINKFKLDIFREGGGDKHRNINSNLPQLYYLFFKGQILQGVVRGMITVGFDSYIRVDI
jgi:hypothetical protein